MSGIHFGVTLPQIKRTWDESKDAAQTFESMGYDSLWVCDHLYGPQSPTIPILEAWSLLAGIAAVTDKPELGTLVTPAGMRNPQQLGKVISTVDNIAGGRVIPGLGAGWMEREFTDFGMPFPPIGGRMKQLRETVELLKQMWDPEQGEVNATGEFVHAEQLVTEPKPPRTPPLLIGGAGEKVTLKLAAEHADIWNNLAAHQGSLERKAGVLRQHMADLGRDPSTITISQQCLVTIAPDDDSAGPMVEQAKKIFGGHMGDPTGPLAIAGSPARVKEQIQKHIDLGCTMFIIEFFGRDTKEPAKLFAETVMPEFR